MEEPKYFNIGSFYDDRGSLEFISDEIPWNKIKRVYTVHNYAQNYVRGIHAHRFEEKYIRCLSGAALFHIAPISAFASFLEENEGGGLVTVIEDYDLNAKIYSFALDSNNKKGLYIPGGFGHGWMGLLPGTKIEVFSNFTTEESKNDDYRFDLQKFNYDKLWKIKER